MSLILASSFKSKKVATIRLALTRMKIQAKTISKFLGISLDEPNIRARSGFKRGGNFAGLPLIKAGCFPDNCHNSDDHHGEGHKQGEYQHQVFLLQVCLLLQEKYQCQPERVL